MVCQKIFEIHHMIWLTARRVFLLLPKQDLFLKKNFPKRLYVFLWLICDWSDLSIYENLIIYRKNVLKIKILRKKEKFQR